MAGSGGKVAGEMAGLNAEEKLKKLEEVTKTSRKVDPPTPRPFFCDATVGY